MAVDWYSDIADAAQHQQSLRIPVLSNPPESTKAPMQQKKPAKNALKGKLPMRTAYTNWWGWHSRKLLSHVWIPPSVSHTRDIGWTTPHLK